MFLLVNLFNGTVKEKGFVNKYFFITRILERKRILLTSLLLHQAVSVHASVCMPYNATCYPLSKAGRLCLEINCIVVPVSHALNSLVADLKPTA